MVDGRRGGQAYPPGFACEESRLVPCVVWGGEGRGVSTIAYPTIPLVPRGGERVE